MKVKISDSEVAALKDNFPPLDPAEAAALNAAKTAAAAAPVVSKKKPRHWNRHWKVEKRKLWLESLKEKNDASVKEDVPGSYVGLDICSDDETVKESYVGLDICSDDETVKESRNVIKTPSFVQVEADLSFLGMREGENLSRELVKLLRHDLVKMGLTYDEIDGSVDLGELSNFMNVCKENIVITTDAKYGRDKKRLVVLS